MSKGTMLPVHADAFGQYCVAKICYVALFLTHSEVSYLYLLHVFSHVGHLLELIEPEEIDPRYKRWLLEDLPILPERFQLKPKSGASERLRALSSLFKRKDVPAFGWDFARNHHIKLLHP